MDVRSSAEGIVSRGKTQAANYFLLLYGSPIEVNMEQIPPELLTKIVIFYRDQTSAGQQRWLEWTATTQVCRRWRTIALEHSALWSEIAIGGPNHLTSWVDAMLERSSAVPIALWARLTSGKSHEEQVARALGHSSGLRSLFFERAHKALPTMESYVRSIPQSAFRSLLDLTLSTYGLDNVLPDGFAANFPPPLQKLMLNRVRLDSWSSTLLGPTLVDLNLEFEGDAGPAVLVLDAFERMVNLEILRLAIPLPDSGDQTRRIELRKLKRFEAGMTMVLGQVGWLLGHLSIPTTAELFIQCEPANEDATDFEKFNLSLQRSWLGDPLNDGLAPKSFQHLAYDFDDYQRCGVLQGWFHYDPSNLMSAHAPMILEVYKDDGKILEAAFPSFPAQDLQYLELETSPGSEDLAALSRAPNLHTIKCNEHNGRRVVNFLTNTPANEVPGVFPSLKHLVFDQQLFASNEDPQSRHTLRVDELTDCLANRKKGGCEIEQVTLEKCLNLFRKGVEEIEGCCSKVTWDGKEEEIEREEEDGYESPESE